MNKNIDLGVAMALPIIYKNMAQKQNERRFLLIFDSACYFPGIHFTTLVHVWYQYSTIGKHETSTVHILVQSRPATMLILGLVAGQL